MTNGRTVLLLAFLLLFDGCQSGQGAEQAPARRAQDSSAQSSGAGAKKSAKLLRYRGKISAIDLRSGTLSIAGSAGEKRFGVQEGTKDAVERLAIGDTVRVSYYETKGKLTISSVRRVKAARPPARQTQPKQNDPAAQSGKAAR
jgi:hypothetical protein